MSNSNCSLTRVLLLQKLEHKSSSRAKPEVRSSYYASSNFPSLSIQNSRTTVKLSIDELQQAIQMSPQEKKQFKQYARDNSVPIADKKLAFRKSSVPKVSQKKLNSLMMNTLSCYFIYRPVSLALALGKRDEYMLSLRTKKRESQSNPLNTLEIKHRLQQFFQKDYRNKGRKQFNIITNEQLRSMKFKKKQQSFHSHKKRKHKDQDEILQEQEEQEEADRITDMATWKRRNAIGQNQKVFIVKGGYEYFRKALLERGWIQNEDVWSPFFDLKWTTKIHDIKFGNLTPDQIVNHFNYNQGLISKFGLAQSLRVLSIKQRVDVNKFFPRCYDLNLQGQFQDFVQNFKFTFVESILNKYLADPDRYKGLQLKVRIAIKTINRRLMSFKQKIQSLNSNDFYFINPAQWAVLTQIDQLTEQQKADWLKSEISEESTIDRQSPTFQEDLYKHLCSIIEQKLSLLKQLDPQSKLSGHHNVWIAKPSFLSRGRGIHCFNNLFQICNYCFGKDLGFVVQKYIERPLLLQGRKFDIRQWVLIEGYNPPKIWVYEECYIRFCAETYSLDNIYNKYVHLTNNSIQKHGNKFQKSSIPGNMWGLQEFVNRIGSEKWRQIKQKMNDVIVLSVKSCEPTIAPRKNSFQLVGYDFMIDQFFNPWLIEVNMSPAMDYSTKVTERLVKKVLTDTAKVVIDKKSKDTGSFKCVYTGGKFMSNHYSLI